MRVGGWDLDERCSPNGILPNISRSNCMNCFFYSPRSQMSEGWSELCVDEDVEGLILAKVEGSGLSAHMKEMVWQEVEKERVRVGDVEETTYNTIASSGIFTCMYLLVSAVQVIEVPLIAGGSLAKPDPSVKREGLVASQYCVLYGRNAIITWIT